MPVTFRRARYLRPAHAALNVLYILLAHGVLLAWFVVAPQALPVWAYVAGSFVVSIMHLKTMSEWVHEAAHYNLLPSRRWNDWLVNALCGVFLANTVGRYRPGHMNHHGRRMFFQPDDPDTDFSIVHSRRGLVLGILGDIFFFNAIKGYLVLYVLPFLRGGTAAASGRARSKVASVVAIIAVHAAAVVGLFSLGRLDAYALYYLTALMLYPLFNRIRAYGQHVHLDEAGSGRQAGSTASRTVDAGLLDRLFVTSPVMMYHYEHHKHPNLPWRALRAMAKTEAGADRSDRNQYLDSRWRLVSGLYAGLDR